VARSSSDIWKHWVGLALIAATRGYRCIFTMPDKVAQRRCNCCEPTEPRSSSVPPRSRPNIRLVLFGRQSTRRNHPRSVPTEPVRNLENPASHYRTQDQRSGNRPLAGHALRRGNRNWRHDQRVGRFLKEQNPSIQIVGADPMGSVFSGGAAVPISWRGRRGLLARDLRLEGHRSRHSCLGRGLFCHRPSRHPRRGLLVGGSCGRRSGRTRSGRDLDSDAVVVVLLLTPVATTSRISTTTPGWPTTLPPGNWQDGRRTARFEERHDPALSTCIRESLRTAISILQEFQVSKCRCESRASARLAEIVAPSPTG